MSQMFGQPLDRAVLHQQAPERGQVALGAQGADQRAEEGHGDLGQEAFDLGSQPFVQGLLRVGGAGGQADDGGDTLQRQEGLGGQGDQGQDQVRDGDFARGALEEAGLASQAWGIQLGQAAAQLAEVLGEGREERLGSAHGYIVLILYSWQPENFG